MQQERTEYLRGFVHGMHFLLLALQGRLTGGAMTPAQVQAVFEEYHRVVEDYRDTFEAPEATQVALRFEDDAPA
jgi:hypothetical protein